MTCRAKRLLSWHYIQFQGGSVSKTKELCIHANLQRLCILLDRQAVKCRENRLGARLAIDPSFRVFLIQNQAPRISVRAMLAKFGQRWLEDA